MLKPTTHGPMNYILYDVIYAEKPWEHAERLAAQALKDESVIPVLPQLLDSIDDVLAKNGWLDELGPLAGSHSEADIKRFLVALRAGIVVGDAPKSGAVSRVIAGEKCTQPGFWFTPALAGSRRYFKSDEVMPEVGGDYGATIWQWDQNQEPPKL